MPDDPETTKDLLRGTSDQLLLAANQLAERERVKRDVAPADARFLELATLVRVAAEDLLRLALEEERIARGIAEGRERTDLLEPIDDVAPPQALAAILAEWRSVEREMAETPPSSPAGGALMRRYEELRGRYAHALARIRAGTDKGS